MMSYHTNLGAGINGLSVREHETPELGLNEVQVRASSLNSRELMVLRGWYPLPVKPDVIPISDGAGDVVAVPLLPGRAAARQGRDRTPLNRKGTASGNP